MLNLIAPINSLGYGVVGQNIAARLDCWLKPIGNVECEQGLVDKIQDRVNRKFEHHSPCIKIWHQHDMTGFTGGMKIGFPIFELNKFSDQEKYHLNYCDRLFVCSDWAKSICEKELDNPDVRVIPLGVDRDIFYPKDKTPSDTIFITIGKWEKRKAHDKIIEAFNRTFSDNDNVHLVMVCDNPFLNQQEKDVWLNKVSSSSLQRKITLLGRQQSQSDINRIMNKATCGVFPALAEGWNLELLEMMSCNKPVITTNYSAHTQFCNEDNSFLIEFDELEPAYDGKFFFGTGDWGKFGDRQMEQLCNHMKYIHENNIKENPAGVETAKQYSWDNTVNEIMKNVS